MLGPSTLIEAVAQGRKAAAAIDAFLGGDGNIEEKLLPDWDTDPRIGRDRQALIMSGAAILQALLRIWPTDRLSVADRGLREGLLYSQMSADGVLTDGTS